MAPVARTAPRGPPAARPAALTGQDAPIIANVTATTSTRFMTSSTNDKTVKVLSAFRPPPSIDIQPFATSARKRCASQFAEPAARRNPQRPYLPVEIGPLDAQRPRRVADPAVVLLEHRRDVVALEPRARLAQGSA